MNKKKKKVRDKLTDASFNDVISAIQKKYGKESIRLIGDIKKVDVPVISTGSVLVDEALGIGGLPRGRIIELYGPNGGGKTTLALHVAAEAQRKNKEAMVLFIDAEHALSLGLAKRMGVDLTRLTVSQPDYGEQGLEIAEMAAESGKFDVVIVDSVSALTPKAEIEGEMTDRGMGEHARMMGKGMRKIAGVNSKTNTMMIFINQLRMKIGVMFGNPETTTGGEALKFFSSVRIDIRRVKAIMEKKPGKDDKAEKGGRVIGNLVRVKIVKNKLAEPYREIETELIFGRGFNKEAELLTLGLEQGILDREGASYFYKSEKFAKSKADAQQVLLDNRKLFKEIKQDIFTARGVKDAQN